MKSGNETNTKNARATATALLVAAAFLRAPPPASAAQCNATDAALRVSYSMTPEAWENLSGDFQRLSIRPSSPVGSAKSSFSDVVEYFSLEDIADYAACVPRSGACLEVTLFNIPQGDYEVSWDGVPAGEGGTYANEFGDAISSTEVGGACVPPCDGSMALFDYEYWSVLGFEDYRVEEVWDGSEVLGCDHFRSDKCQMRDPKSIHRTRACLARDACYRFLVGDNFVRTPDIGSQYSLRWDGAVLDLDLNGEVFHSLDFGERCEPSCDPTKESLVEFFMHRVESEDCQGDPDLTWELKLQNFDGTWSATSSGTVPACSNSSLYHEQVCVPRDNCVLFIVSSTNAREFTSPLYSLSLDGVIYKQREMNIDDTSSEFNGLSQTTMMGGCTADDLCIASAEETMLEVEVAIPLEYTYSKNDTVLTPNGYGWTLVRAGRTSEYSLKSRKHFDQGFMNLGSTYRTVECVPGDTCFEFQFWSHVPIEYKLRINGVEVQDHKKMDSGFGRGIEYTAQLGEGCVENGENAEKLTGEYDGGSDAQSDSNYSALGKDGTKDSAKNLAAMNDCTILVVSWLLMNMWDCSLR